MTVRTYAPFAAVLVLSTGLLLATPAAPAQDQKTPPDVTLMGCLIQGSGPAVFLLDNARPTNEDPKTAGKTYVLATTMTEVDFKSHVSHEVTITGTVDEKIAPVPPPGQKVPEKDLSKLWAKNLSMVADKCTPTPR